jgi:GNAT superfamily N-acetyltransferase/2'-5' RNA ligase
MTYLLGDGTADPDGLIGQLGALAGDTNPITIHATGLGLFPGEPPTLYLPVPRGPALAAAHQAVFDLFTDWGGAVQPHYRPERWIPHVTLASHELAQGMLPAAVADLPLSCLEATGRVLGFCLATAATVDQWEIVREFPFRGQDALGPNPFGLSSRPCQPSDQGFIHRLVVEALKPLVSAFHPWSEARFGQGFASNWRQLVIVLAEGRPVGTIQYDDSPADHFYIANLLLTAPARGRGWGRWLLGYLEGRAQGKPVRLHVWENNPAVGFYQRHSYRITQTEAHKHLMEKR